jgi:hypothetical protein
MPFVEPFPPPPSDEPDPTETIEVPSADGGREPAAAASYALMVASGPRRGLHWAIGEGLQAGRSPDADIFLDDVTVSRHHAEFGVEGGVLVVRDLGSTNGTYVNGVRSDESVLDVGDHVIIGRFHLIVAADS